LIYYLLKEEIKTVSLTIPKNLSIDIGFLIILNLGIYSNSWKDDIIITFKIGSFIILNVI